MKVLVINCGSSTVKFQLIEVGTSANQDQKLATGLVDCIGEKASCEFSATTGQAYRQEIAIKTHEEAVAKVFGWLDSVNITGARTGGIDAVGHRVVHGGDAFTEPVTIDDSVIARIESFNDLAPLHNPPAVSGIRAVRRILGPSISMIAAFDTSFHHTIPDEAAIYAIPRELSIKHRIRRYGFHGLAHQYSCERYGEMTGTPRERTNIVTLHLGNGCSATAIRGGESVDTSMGFTPLEGLVMGTRSGDLDPALIGYLARKEGVSVTEVEDWMNKQSGLLGLSGVSSDMRELIATVDENPGSALAVEVFCYRARKYVGAYLAALGGAQALVFSGGMGENAPLIREKICAGMDWCGIKLDPEKNKFVEERDGAISSTESRIKVYVIHTDEEAIIARATARLVSHAQK